MSPCAKALLAVLVAALCLPAAAQSTARPRPPGTVPLDEPAPPPPIPPAGTLVEPPADPKLAPQVTERRDGDTVIQEYRIGGKLYMQKVKPRNGPAYVLMDHRGDGTFSRLDNTLDPGVRVPQWVLLEF